MSVPGFPVIRTIVVGVAFVLVGSSARLTAQVLDTLRPPSIQDSTLDPAQYRFLRLGVGNDYLGIERRRLVDQIEQAIPPLFEPRTPFHGYTLPSGTWRVGLSAAVGRNPGDFGRDGFYSLFFDNVAMDVTTIDLNVVHGFELGGVRDLVLRVNVPFRMIRASGTGHPFRIDPMIMTMEGTSEGIGDVSVTLKKKWMDQATGPVTFSTMVGVIVPTAENSEEFNASQTVTMGGMAIPVTAASPMDPIINVFGRTPTDRLLPRSAQPGNGSWGGRVGFGLTRQFSRSAFHGGAILDLLARNDGITPGHELRYGVSYVVPPLSSDQVTLDLAVTGLFKGDESFPGTIVHMDRDPATGGPRMDAEGNLLMVETARPDFAHGNVTFLSPALIVIPAPNLRFFLSPSVRVFQPSQGPSPRWTVALGQTFTF